MLYELLFGFAANEDYTHGCNCRQPGSRSAGHTVECILAGAAGTLVWCIFSLQRCSSSIRIYVSPSSPSQARISRPRAGNLIVNTTDHQPDVESFNCNHSRTWSALRKQLYFLLALYVPFRVMLKLYVMLKETINKRCWVSFQCNLKISSKERRCTDIFLNQWIPRNCNF